MSDHSDVSDTFDVPDDSYPYNGIGVAQAIFVMCCLYTAMVLIILAPFALVYKFFRSL